MALENEFIIGLGGVGGRCVKEFCLTRVIRENDTERLKEKDTKFELLYIDSNDDIYRFDWKIYAKDVKIPAQDFIHLKGAASISISDIAKESNVEPWIGDLASQYGKRAKTKSKKEAEKMLQGLEGASQLRRFGRALFASKANNVRIAIRTKITSLIQGRDKKINVRIFCTLGGGTGSGSLIDMITLVKTAARDLGCEAKIYVYPFVAGAAASGQNAGSFYENEYAALRDLNALMVRKYHPHIAAGEKCIQYKGENPVSQVFISSEMSPGSLPIDDQIRHIVNAYYDLVVYMSGCAGTNTQNAIKAVTLEDLVQGTPGEPAKNSSDRSVVRSYAFAALGARRWCVPTNQIRELLKLDTEKRVLECWLKGSAAPRNIDQYLQPGFDLMTGSCITTLGQWQEKSIAELDAQLKDINDNNKRDADTLIQIRVTSDRLVQEAKNLEFDPNFALTMNPLYEADAQRLFAVLEGNVNTVIQWRNASAWGLEDIKALLEQVNTELPAWVNRLMAGTTVPGEDADKDLVQQMQNREAEWPKLGWLAIHMGHKDEEMILNQGKDAKQRVLDVFTRMRKTALEKIVDFITQKLNGLRSIVSEACKDVQSKIDDVQLRIEGYEAELTNHDGEGTSASGDMYVYDAENLRKVRDLMAAQTQKLHDQMLTTYNKLWEDTVGNVSQYTSAKLDSLCTGIDGNLYETSKFLHDAVTANKVPKPVLVASILESLSQDRNSEAEWKMRLGPLVRKFASTVGTSVELQDTQGLEEPQKAQQAALIIGFPEKTNQAPLRKWLTEQIQANIPCGSVMQDKVGIYEHSSMYEIRMLYIPHWFPVRFATVTDYVYSKYRQSCQSEEKKGYVSYFANIDDNDNGLASINRPPLRLDGDPDTENKRKFEVASGLKYSTGSREFAVVSRNKDGQITFLRSIDEMNVPEYTKGFDDSKVSFPDDDFTESMDAAIELAKETMTPEQKTAHMKQYADRLAELYDKGKSESEEYEETKAKYTLLKELLADD